MPLLVNFPKELRLQVDMVYFISFKVGYYNKI